MIRTEKILFKYESTSRPVLRDISLKIEEGEYVTIMGANGCGKTTLIRHLNGLLTPWSGSVTVDGLSTSEPGALSEIRQRVGMVFQNPDSQIVGMSVEEDVAFGPGNIGLPPHEIRERVHNALERVGIGGLLKRNPHTLSSGEKQLLAIAGALAMRPRYLVLDEPTAYLDPSMTRQVLDVVRRLHNEGITVIHVTHDMDEIVGSQRVVVMNEGRIILDDSPTRVFNRVDILRPLGLGIPKVTELMRHLWRMGTDVRPDILTIDEACEEILSLLDSQKKITKRSAGCASLFPDRPVE